RDGLLLVHHSMGNDTVSEVARLPARKAVVYHNITPAKYFEGLNEHARRYAEVGREQLLELAKSAEFGFADSEYNRRELAEAGCVTIEQLVAYYRGATAFLTLSDHEGFCVPLLEAMRSDLPIVAHAAGAIPETLGDAGVLLEEKSPSAVAAALERVVRDQAVRKDLLEKGHRRVEEFSREKVAGRLKLALAQGGWDLPAPRAK